MCCQYWYRFRNGGNQWSGWAGYLSFFHRVAELKLPIYDRWVHYEVAAEGGPRFMHKEFWMVSDRPEFIHRDDRNRPHSIDGPFCRWRDGWAIYRWHGVTVTEEIVTGRFTAKDIDAEKNAEVRRCMIEKYGADRYLRETRAELIHEDVDGLGQPRKLWRKEVLDDEPIVMVEVVNSTVEHDGSRKTYFLRVHPELRPLSLKGLGEPQKLTAHNAVASTFGMRGEEYRPAVET